ncbi:MAG: histidine phosphatase family protein [Pseudomonadota bacterium]
MTPRRILFTTHADVVIDPDVPVPDWPLSERGRARHAAQAQALAAGPVPAAIWSSGERKARDAAEILAAATGVAHRIAEGLHENDRSATGFLPPDEFEQTADAFFAHPDQSIRGWETARQAQARIVREVGACVAATTDDGDVWIVAHGGVGALLLAHVTGQPISRALDQPGRGGGNAFAYTDPPPVLDHGWRDISELS